MPTTATTGCGRWFQTFSPCGRRLRPGEGSAGERGDLTAERARHPVQVHRHDDDGDAGLEAEAHIDVADGAVDGAAEASAADHAGDDHHGQAQHDDLVDARHDRGQGERQLHPQQGVAPGGAECFGRLDEFAVDLADAELGHPDARGQREDDGGDDAGDHADAEKDDAGDQIDHGGHGLHEVQDGPGHRADGLGAGRPDAQRYGHYQRDDGGDEHQGEGVHRFVPQLDGVDDGEADEGEHTREQTAQPPGDDGDDAREEQRCGGGEHGGYAVEHAADDRADRVEQPGKVGLQPVDRGVDPVTERKPKHWPPSSRWS